MATRVVKAISEIADVLISEAVNLPSLKVVESPRIRTARRGDPETFVLLLSDLQVGIKTSTYNFQVFRQRMSHLIENIIKVVKLHRHSHPVNNLVVFLMGDLVHNENILRFVNLDELEGVIREQLFENAIPALKDFFVEMLRVFRSVEVVCVHGNHGSFGKLYAKSTNLDDIAYYFLKEMFRDNHRINFKLTQRFFNFHEVYGWKFLIVHGDTIPMHLTLP